MEQKRVSIKLKRPNPLFEQWLTEWRDREKARGSKMEKCFALALTSLKKYPLPLLSGKDCIILEGFGQKLCKMIDQRLESHNGNMNEIIKTSTIIKPQTKNNVEALTVHQRNVEDTGKNDENSKITTATTSTIVKKKGRPVKKLTSSSSLASDTPEENFILPTGTFDIILLVDTQETSGASKKDEDPIIYELEKSPIRYEVRHLKVGDYCWIARDYNSNRELVLPYVIERKRIDDFGASIKDGRFHEQKFRLKQTALPKLIYLVENYKTRHTGLPLSTLQQAAMNTLVQDGFIVKFSEGLKGSVEYLVNLTRVINRLYEDKTLASCLKKDLDKTDLYTLMTFSEFNAASAKNKSFKVQELFIRQLLQLKGVSVDKALAIVEAYPTPNILRKRYDECTPKDGENLLSTLPFGKLRKNIGPVISKTIYQLFNFNTY